MTKMRYYLSLICLISVFIQLLSGCSAPATEPDTTVPVPDFSITLSETVPAAKQGEVYDLKDLYVRDKTLKYSAEVTYFDEQAQKDIALEVKNMKVTPVQEGTMTVTIFASKDDQTVSAEVSVPVKPNGDIKDLLLKTGGEAGPADNGVMKLLNNDAQYVYGDSSATSLKVIFSNPSQESNGTKLFELSHYAMLSYYSSNIWENSAVAFWVYNPMEQDVEFRLTSFNPNNDKCVEWDSEDNTQHRIAKAGQWTQIVFALHPMGIDKILYNSPDGSREDELFVLARYAGSEQCTVYVDDIDVVDARKFEDLETGVVQIAPPKGNFNDLLKDYTILSSSKKVTFKTTTERTNNSESAFLFAADEPVGYPYFEVRFGKTIDIRGFKFLKFDVFADNSYPWLSISLIYKTADGTERSTAIGIDYKRETWVNLKFDLQRFENVDLTKVIGVRIHVAITENTCKDGITCKFFFDNMRFTAESTTEPLMEPAQKEDDDLLSGTFMPYNIKPGLSGICKVAADDEGIVKSNSTLVFWANTPIGYPKVYAEFTYDSPQDWTKYEMLSVDTHIKDTHYRIDFDLITYDEQGNQVIYNYYVDAALTQWMTRTIPLDWFTAQDGSKPDLSAVYGMRISVDMSNTVRNDIGYIYVDNLYIS